MFNYGAKNNAILIGIFILLIVGMVFLLRWQNSQSRDIVLMSQAKLLGIGLEMYYDDFNSYPISNDKIDATAISYITENGINQQGDKIYYLNKQDWPSQASYTSNGSEFTILFDVENDWPSAGLVANENKQCYLVQGVNFGCL